MQPDRDLKGDKVKINCPSRGKIFDDECENCDSKKRCSSYCQNITRQRIKGRYHGKI